MQQIVDLEGSQEFRALDVQLVSIATDSVSDLALAARQYPVSSPLLSDQGGKVVSAYDVLQWAMSNGEPGHTFVLIGKDGKVRWIRDYGAMGNGGRMYVPVPEINQELGQRLNVR